jgi:hypothetical protein
MTGQLRDWLKKHKRIVFLFSMKNTFGSQLTTIGKWMLGSELTRKTKFTYYVEKFDGKSTSFNLS